MSLVFGLALRSLLAHRVKSTLVGTIMVGGAFLVVVALALLDGVESAMERSITGSVAGDLQLYDARASDPLVLLGSTFISVPDVGRIDRYEAVEEALASVPEVQAVVPMGFDIGSMATPGQLDRALSDLRALVRSEAPEAEITRSAAVVRELVEELAAEVGTRRVIASDDVELQAQEAQLQEFTQASFWESFRRDPLAGLERLDVEVAPLGESGGQVLFRYLGTDLERFREQFSGFKLVKGTFVPPGERGFLFSDRLFEQRVKHRIARGLDFILERLEDGETIAEDPGQQARVRRLARQWRRVTRELDSEESEKVKVVLQEHLGMTEELPQLLEAFLTVDDQNLRVRRDLFYAQIAPFIELYALRPGDTVTLRSFTRRGFLRSVNVKLYGTYAFRGLESSDLAGVYNLTDLVTFRYLYGVMGATEQAELDALRAEAGLEDLGADEVEEALFGEGAGEVVETFEADTLAAIEAETFAGAEDRGLGFRIPQGELQRGMVLDVAVLLASGVERSTGRKAVARALEAAGLELNITDWQAAAGLIGQFIVVIRVVLYVAITIIFLVALVIINNALVTATMERTTEIGTLRAIGAQRGQILLMFFIETLLLGLAAAALGAAAGGALVLWWGSAGLPAPNRALQFVFGGPELFPALSLRHILTAGGAILVIGLLSTAYPAWLGARVPPVEAMRAEE